MSMSEEDVQKMTKNMLLLHLPWLEIAHTVNDNIGGGIEVAVTVVMDAEKELEVLGWGNPWA